ncbi:hypothetical protein N7U66_08240 [Lacinutrix neustonica]|uniref:Uncharacterized protein n=1 Tax=Lacinutrix neustonica TaxID=2980107 RepID=A0A9E8N072_9FLAO|nr:hypothetical protein [Lacinutrix neustonica]WAC03465.1 hypothetical protein N7U66_08240 [Lacinutrix neustonica]
MKHPTIKKGRLIRTTDLKRTFNLLFLFALSIVSLSCGPSEDDSPEPTPIIDLQADDVVFMITPTSSIAFDGTATITGRVKNMADNFISVEGQQVILLYERSLGTPTDQPGTEIGRVEFTTLRTGETMQVSYTRPWNSASPAEGEFPPEYILRLSLDPDIQIDGNVHNNDNNSENNELIVSGKAINQLF